MVVMMMVNHQIGDDDDYDDGQEEEHCNDDHTKLMIILAMAINDKKYDNRCMTQVELSNMYRTMEGTHYNSPEKAIQVRKSCQKNHVKR